MDHRLKILIRQAEPEDAAAIAELYRKLCPDQPTEVDQVQVGLMADDPNCHLLVAEIDGKVLGTVLLLIVPDSLFGSRPVGMIRNLIVEEGVRRMGVGRKLMTVALRIGRNSGVTTIALTSAPHRDEGHALFKSVGCKEVRGFVYYAGRG